MSERLEDRRPGREGGTDTTGRDRPAVPPPAVPPIERVSFDEKEPLPSKIWGKKIAAQAERSIGNLELRMKVAYMDAQQSKERSHVLEMRSQRHATRYEKLENARSEREAKIESLKDPERLLNRFAITSWINEKRVGVLQTLNRFTSWKLGRAQDRLLNTNSEWRAEKDAYSLADQKRLQFAEMIDKRIQNHLEPIQNRLNNVNERLGTLQEVIQNTEGIVLRLQQRVEHLSALRKKATNGDQIAEINKLIEKDRGAIRQAQTKLQRELFPRLAKAQKHYERTSRAMVLASAAQEKIAARYNRYDRGAPEADPAEREHYLPAGSTGSSDPTPVGRYLAGLGSAGDLDLRGMIEALFAKPMTAEKITEEWNRRNGDVAPVKTEELINFLKEAGYTDDDLAQNEGKFEAKDWAGMLKKAAKYSDTFRGLIASTKGENKGREARKTDDQFIDGFIDSLTD